MIFNRKNISIKSDKTKDGIKYYVDFGKLSNKKEFKIKLISSLFQDDLVLGVIDTSLMYSSSLVKNEELSSELKELCNKYSIENKIIKTPKEDKGIFGTKVKIGDKAKGYNYIFGLILDRSQIEKLSDIINKYNASFFAADNKDALESFDLDYQDKVYDLYIFIDNYMDRVGINSKGNRDIKTILDKVKEECDHS